MKPNAWLVGGLLALVGLGVGAGVTFHVGPVFSVCEQDSEMPGRDRQAISDLALELVQAMRSGDIDAAEAMLSEEARAATERSGLVSASEQVGAVQPSGEPVVRHVFRLFLLGMSTGSAMCGAPSDATLLARGGGMRTAFAEIAEPVSGAERTWVVWLEREQGEWRVRAFHMVMSAIAGRDGAQMWRMADEQAARGHAFNATLLYDIASGLLDRGPNMQPPKASEFASARSRLSRHADLPGSPPLTFALGEKTFPVGWISSVGTREDNALTLIIDQRGPIADEASAVAHNREFIDAMNEHRAEWREVFDALAVGYPTGDGGRVWRTVYSRENGYLTEASTATP